MTRLLFLRAEQLGLFGGSTKIAPAKAKKIETAPAEPKFVPPPYTPAIPNVALTPEEQSAYHWAVEAQIRIRGKVAMDFIRKEPTTDPNVFLYRLVSPRTGVALDRRMPRDKALHWAMTQLDLTRGEVKDAMSTAIAKMKAHAEKKNPVKRPGSRGGIGYYDEHGAWIYGEKPVVPGVTAGVPADALVHRVPTAAEIAAAEARHAAEDAAREAPPAEQPPAEPPTPPAEPPPGGGSGGPGEPAGGGEPPSYDPEGKTVPGGFYAVPSRTGKNDLDFFKVDIGRAGGRYEGKRFVMRIIGGSPGVNLDRQQAADALVRIQHYGVPESMERYGVEIGRCGYCGKTLTSEWRFVGIGPECAAKLGRSGPGKVDKTVDPNMPARPVLPPLEEKPPPPVYEPPPPPAPEVKEGESVLDALRDECKTRGIQILDTEGMNPKTKRKFPVLSFIGNTYPHNGVFQKLKGPGGVWGKSLPDGRFAWHIRADNAEAVLEAFNAERARRIAAGDRGGTRPGEGGSGGPGVQPGSGEPGGGEGGESGVGSRGVLGRLARDNGPALQPEALWNLSADELASIQPPAARTVVDPAIEKVLVQHQAQDVGLIADAWQRGEKGFLLGNQTGTGKTFVGLGAIAQINPARSLVIVPNQAIAEQWAAEAKRFGLTAHPRIPTNADERGIFVTTYAALRLQDAPGRFGLLLPDEVHQQAMKLAQGKRTAELIADLSGRSTMTVYSTATPFEAPQQVYYLRQLGLWPPVKGAWREWAEKHNVHFIEKKVGWGKYITVPTWRGDRESKLLDMLRIRAALVKPGLAVFRDIESDQHLSSDFRALPQHTGEFADQVSRAIHALDDLSSAALRTNATKRLLDYVKLDAAAEDAARAVQAGKHVVMMVSNKAPFRFDDPPELDDEKMPSALRQEMIGLFRNAGLVGELPSPTELLRQKVVKIIGDEKKVATYTGDVTDKKRAKLKSAFQAGTLPVLISTIAAGGTGLSLHDTVGNAPRYQINVGLPWTGKDFSQMIGRTYRVGVKSPVEQVFFWTDAPRERRIAEVVAGRLAAMKAGVQGIVAESNAAKLAEFAIRGTDIEDDIDEQTGFAKSRRWNHDLGCYEDEID